MVHHNVDAVWAATWFTNATCITFIPAGMEPQDNNGGYQWGERWIPNVIWSIG